MSIYLCIWCEQTCSFSYLRDVATRSIQIIHYFHSPSTNFDSIRNANIFILNPLLFIHLWIMDNTLNTTFNDISVTLRSQFYLLGKTGLPEKKTPSCGKSLIFFYHNMFYRIHLALCNNWTLNFSGDYCFEILLLK